MSTGRILVVDDEETAREMLREYFAAAGYEVVAASGGEEAIGKFVPERFDCIICDLFMPDKGGMDVLKTIRLLDSKVVFLMVTGYPSIDNAIQAMKEGASDYITKPFNMDDIMIKVERALHAKKTEQSLKRVTGLFWGIIISIPIWLILGIVLGIFWKK
jgi:DNA-binding NtrC family response regulator